MRRSLLALGTALALSACNLVGYGEKAPLVPQDPARADADTLHPDLWPAAKSGVTRDPAIEAKVAKLVKEMTVEEKVGQILQADWDSVTPEDVKKYHLGSTLVGGNSGPRSNDRALAPEWLKMQDEYYAASMDVAAGRPAIPEIWGSDAVHGNSNIIGATIFPHNIGLGAMHDPALMRRIGEVTAKELRVVGGDWTFAPTIAVVRDDRWGRTYEAYSEDPKIVAQYAPEILQGIQGKPGDADFLRGPHVLSSIKHYLGDGGTDKGKDQGDNIYSEAQFRDLFSPGYRAAIEAGAQIVMTSYNSWHGQKSTGNRKLLTDILVGRFGFDGFLVDDWNAHSQVTGCTASDCPAALNAGVDLFMAPDSWRGLYDNLLKEVKAGTVPMARLNEAVARVLRVKFRAGVFDEGKPSSRPFAGKWDLLGAPEHRAVARQAVRESLVLLKNDNHTLPLKAKLRVLVAGDGADNLPKQTGGWTISWQGTGNSRADFPNGVTIYEGINKAVGAAGGKATLSADGSFKGRKPDVAIVVFGENPYAEFQGDIATLEYQPGDKTDLALLKKLKAAKIPVVAVFLSGRPLYVTPEINASDAFVAAWLPGTEGGGIADMLLAAADGKAAHDFTGKLSFSWPKAPNQFALNVGDANYDPLFAYGYGLTYADTKNIGAIPEAQLAAGSVPSVDRYILNGKAIAPWKISIDGAVTSANAPSTDNALDASWTGSGTLTVSGDTVDLSRQANGDMALSVQYRLKAAPAAAVMLTLGCGANCSGSVDVSSLLQAAKPGAWSTAAVRLSCFAKAGADLSKVIVPFAVTTTGKLDIAIRSARLAAGEGTPSCPAK